MKLAGLNTQVRQRTPWEAIDLGFALVRHNWGRIYLPWTLLIVLLAVCVWLLVPEKYAWAAGLTIWWLKPLYDRILLFGYSRGLFGYYPGVAETFSAIPGLLRRNGLFSALTWRRLSLSRSYNLPIWQLEGLRGKARKERQSLLYLQGHGHAIALTLACKLLELVLTFSLYGLVVLLDPSGNMGEHLTNLLTGKLDPENEYWQTLVDFIFMVAVTLIIEPCFVAAGFSLYLNRRTQLEAWDLEITLRSLGERLRTVVQPVLNSILLACMLGVLAITSVNNTAHAASTDYLAAERQPVEQLQQELDTVMQSEELSSRNKITIWASKNKTQKKTERQLSKEVIALVSFILKSLLWVAVIIALVLLAVYHRRILELLKPLKTKRKTIEQPEVLFGLDIRPESLPADIAAAARQNWEAGNAREALSLLYRGALMLLTREQDLNILDSHTEGDVLQLSRQKLSGLPLDYLHTLTRHWQYMAYAHRQPSSAEMEHLLTQWPEFQSTPVARAEIQAAEVQA